MSPGTLSRSRLGKLALVLIAAWAPLLLAGKPWLAAAAVLIATILFFLMVGSAQGAAPSAEPPKGDIHEGG